MQPAQFTVIRRCIKCKRKWKANLIKQHFIHNRTSETKFNSQRFYYCLKNRLLAHLGFGGSNTLGKKLGHSRVYKRGWILLTTVHKHLGTEEGSYWTFRGGMLSHFCLFSLYSVLFVIFYMSQCTKCFQVVKAGLQAGQSST